MKLKFDENISTRLVQAIRVLERDKSIEIGSVLEDYGAGIPDPDWMFRFRDEGGQAMISGDHNILQKNVNLVAYTESGLISIWPPPGFPKLKLLGQAALIVRWWTAIKLKIATSEAGSRWRFPASWTPSDEAFEPLEHFQETPTHSHMGSRLWRTASVFCENALKDPRIERSL